MIRVMVNGMPGNMAQIIAAACEKRGFEVIPFSLTGEALEEFKGKKLLSISNREALIAEVLKQYPNLIAIDYTHPSAVNGNAEFYVRHKIPFVMGTTGGDREALMELVRNAKHPCVIAPNMAKQIVALQAMLEWATKTFPGVFKGYDLRVVESHQKTKADISGTAKALVKSFLEMGATGGEPLIEAIRDKEHGHAFHTYTLDSADKTVHFEFQHNILGRDIYGEGTADAVEYLSAHLSENRCFDMIDVLRG